MALDRLQEQSTPGGVDMKVAERTGMWIELEKTADRDDEITVRVPNSIWVGWMMPIYLKDDDLAAFLRSIGWRVDLPHTTRSSR